MKLGIIGGAGLLGSTTAFYVGSKNLVDEIKLIDLRENIVNSHVMDLNQAFLTLGGTKVTAASYEDLYDCDIILSAAAFPEQQVQSRNESLSNNIKIILPISDKLKAYCKKDTVLITSAAPIDVLNYVYWKILGWDKKQFIGFCANDTLRFKWALQEVTGKSFDRFDALCIGEHGEAQVRLYDQVKCDGQPLKLVKDDYEKIEEKTTNWFAQWQSLNCHRTTGWTSAVMMTAYIEAIVKNTGAVLPCSTVLADQFGYSHVSFGMPCKLGNGGIQEVIDPLLSDEQKLALGLAAKKIDGLISSIGF